MSDRFVEEKGGFDIIDTLNDLYYESYTIGDVLEVLNNMDDEVKNSLKIISRNIFYVNESTDNIVFDDKDLNYLKFLLEDKLKYGGDTVTEMVKYSELYSKIENLLEENTINE